MENKEPQEHTTGDKDKESHTQGPTDGIQEARDTELEVQVTTYTQKGRRRGREPLAHVPGGG